MLLEFLNMSGAEIGIILAIIAIPVLLIIYCIVDIVRSDFKVSLMKFAFLALVLFAPFLGSIIYLAMRKNYLKTNHNLPIV